MKTESSKPDQAVLEVNIKEIPLFKKGKVREVYDLGDRLLLVASDRISAYDVVLPEGIPDKGAVLTGLSCFWFERMKSVVPHHVISSDVNELPRELAPYFPLLRGRSLIVRKTKPLPVECVVRGYLAGSGWKEYQKSRSVCGVPLPGGLKESSKLHEPVFTPATKAESGHDENISEAEMKNIIGEEAGEQVKKISIEIYKQAAGYALQKGIIIADTKFEFGYDGDQIILIDEALTPDSSRFWPVDKYKEGESPFSYDKQYVRDYLESIRWNKTPPAPSLPEEVIRKTQEKYLEAYQQLTGHPLDKAD